jgi:hypothetical protein
MTGTLYQLANTLGYADQRTHIRAAGFEQQNPLAPIFGQPVGQHAPGGTRAHDDVVEFAGLISCICHGIPPIQWPIMTLEIGSFARFNQPHE